MYTLENIVPNQFVHCFKVPELYNIYQRHKFMIKSITYISYRNSSEYCLIVTKMSDFMMRVNM